MREITRWQIVSFISRGVAMAMGIIQSVFVVRILSVSEYGLINIVTSIGAAFGIYQHLGLASGSTREISSAEDEDEVFKVFATSVLIRYFVTVPLAVILFVFSKYIAITQYNSPEIVFPLRLFSIVLLIQGVQSIFNSVISGTHRFKELFIYQAVIAVVSLFVYIPLIFYFRVDGYFMALIVFNFIGSISLGIIAMRPLKSHIAIPSKDDFKRLLKEILSISLGIYAVKIIYTYWQKSGPILLGLEVSPEQVGIFSFALLYGAKLMAVSDAVTDVNLPVLSREFVNDVSKFKEIFGDNFDKVFAFIVFSGVSAIFWSKEVISLLVGHGKYDGSFPLVIPLVYAFIFYSFVNIVKSSIFIPAKYVKEMIASFVLMLVITAGFYFLFSPSLGFLNSMAYGMVAGAFVGILFMDLVSWVKLKFNFITVYHIIALSSGALLNFFDFGSFWFKAVEYTVFVLIYMGILFLFGVLKKSHLNYLLDKVRKP